MSTRSSLCTLCLVLCLPQIAQAGTEDRTIVVLLKNVSGAPTPEQVVQYINTWPHAPNPPLQAFGVRDPVASSYLLPDRATGDFLLWLQLNPSSARRKLEDTVFMAFSAPEDVPEALAALQLDPFVESADAVPLADFHPNPSADSNWAGLSAGEDTQYGWFDMNLDQAWATTGGGYALIAHIDDGVAVDHAALRAFSGASYAGGNLVLAGSRDVGLTGQTPQPGFDEKDVDEGKPEWIAAGACAPSDTLIAPARLGHGTHTAGLLAANEASGLGVRGTCKHCGIAEYRSVYLECFPQFSPPQVLPVLNFDATNRAKVEGVDTGAQVLALSFGLRNPTFSYNCVGPLRTNPMCLSIAYAAGRDSSIVASSGNKRQDLDFPASDTRVISAGGFQSDLALWDESPGNIANCPPAPGHDECGSNYTKPQSGVYRTHQELLGSSRHVLSTTYPNSLWADYAECGDAYGTPPGDGVGWCTGTSMSAPQIAGAIGLLRSVNPLVSMGMPEPPVGTALGLRAVLAQTASQAAIGQAWNPGSGYGIPDVAAAARRLLGKVAGGGVRNRATPLFRLYSAYATDFAETTSPQYALSLMIAQAHQYVQPTSGLGVEPAVPGYAFPYEADDPNNANDTFESTPPAAPRAAIYVLATDVKPRGEWPALVPLYLMEKPKASGRDHLLVTTKSDIEAAHAGGYDIINIQGYIYEPCALEPACVPPGSEPLYRQCNQANSDCATFLESERAAFEAGGYTYAYPPGSVRKLGYAYPATDADPPVVVGQPPGDGLPDGFEYVIGTSPAMQDSDFDGVSDAAEYPLAGVPVSDPCAGGIGAFLCPADSIFRNGYDGF